jgi:hypothetical protein
MAIKRLHYFDHQFLIQGDFTDEQTYHLDMRRRLNRLFYTFGIAEGLTVVKSGPKEVTVRPGVALDRLGREMIVEANQPVNLSQFTQGGTNVVITIAYDEKESDQSVPPLGNRRITEQPIITPVQDPPPPPTDGTVIQLARFTLDASGNVPGNINDLLDGGVRQTIRTLGGLVSIQGVSNPGGNVGLIQGTGIIITPNLTNRTITIANSVAPGLVSVDGVSNPGGNVDLIAPQGQAIVITPNDATNQITFSETHSTQTGNVHNLTAANLQTIGALLASDYDLRQRQLANVTFTQADANNAARTVPLSFQARMVLVVGTCTAGMGTASPPRVYGGGVTAFAFGPNLTSQRGFGVSIIRASNTDWVSRPLDVVGIASASFTNSEVATQPPTPQSETLTVAITGVTATGLTATLTRTLTASSVALPNFTISLNLLCMG